MLVPVKAGRCSLSAIIIYSVVKQVISTKWPCLGPVDLRRVLLGCLIKLINIFNFHRDDFDSAAIQQAEDLGPIAGAPIDNPCQAELGVPHQGSQKSHSGAILKH